MLSSTVVLELLFVLFVDTFARSSHGNPVIPYAQYLQSVGLSGVHLKFPESSHAASDSTNPVSRPIGNARRALSGTGTSNGSSLDALRLALVDNSSNPVEATKSTPIVIDTETPTCYRSREAAPIATPADCNMAIYEMMGRGDPHDAEFWSGSRTLSRGTCKVQLVSRGDYGDFLTRRTLRQAALLIKRDCITAEHGYRGGYVTVGMRMIFYLRVWASTSSGIVNETTSAFSSLSDLPDLSEEEQTQR